MKTVVKILKKPVTSTFIAIFIGFIVAAIILGIAGYNPVDAFGALFQGVFSKPKYISNTIIKATPIILTGLSVAFAFKTGIAGGIIALMHAVASITFKADQTISGIAINLIGPGLALFLCRLFFKGAAMTPPVANKLPKIFGENVSNSALQSLNVDSTVVLALILTVALWFVLYKTKWGLHIRSVGEKPAAADTMGINVTKVRYICVILSGVLAGFGGAAMTLAIIPQFTQTAISGQGFIALAAVIFGKWTPQGAYGACLLFGFSQALTVMLGGGKVVIPSEILAMLPYILTIIVLILFVGKSVAPKADGVPYEKGAR